jgi:ureidoacrylate peracid hydrolase
MSAEPPPMTVVHDPLPPLSELLTPDRCALIAIDVQHQYLDGGFAVDLDGFIASLGALLTESRRVGVQRVLVRAVERPEFNSAVWLSRHATKTQRLGNFEGTHRSEFLDIIQPEPDDLVVTKHRYNAFLNTGLDSLLRARQLDALVFTGVQSNVCVELTASEAFQRDYWTVIVGDATTTSTPDRQEQALRDAGQHWGRVVSAGDVLGVWAGLPPTASR